MIQLRHLIKLILKRPDLSVRAVARQAQVGKSTVQRYRLALARRADTWEVLQGLSLKELHARYNREPRRAPKAPPDFTAVAAEMAAKRKGATLWGLWREYREAAGDRALSYSRFAHLYKEHCRDNDTVLRQEHAPGYAAYVDYSGQRASYIDAATGQAVEVEIFVGVLPCSNLIFVRAALSQTVLDWLDVHVRMLDYFGGAPLTLVPDNLRAAVAKSGRDGEIQRAYLAFAEHHGIAIHPARPYRPRDKGKVEKSVSIVQREILFPLRARVFHSLDELNAALLERLEKVNRRSFQKKHLGSRWERFTTLEKPALQPLPAERFAYAETVGRQRVPKDYHVRVHDHFYSVPFEHVGHLVEASITPEWVEIYRAHALIARHRRSVVKGARTTAYEHHPEKNRAQLERTPEGFARWADGIGPNVSSLVAAQFENRKVPLQGLHACDALKNLAHRYGAQQLERAAGKAVALRMLTVDGVKRCLSDKPAVVRWRPAVAPTNLRGADHYKTRVAA